MMNDPEYILTDEMALIVEATRQALIAADGNGSWPVLNYQYGTVEELNETLKQYEADPEKFQSKYPLIWLAEPFTINHGEIGIYGKTEVDIFLIRNTEKTWKAADRMENNYKPYLYPIRRKLLDQIVLSAVFDITTVEGLSHKTTKGYYWGESQKAVLNDAVDCLKLGALSLRIHNKYCTPTKSF